MTISYTVSENIKPKMKKNKKSTNKKSEKKQLQIIGQGTYGCVFRPEINCRTQQSGSKDYLSKIQMADNISSAEIELGKIIQTIPNYRFFFAPILSYCDINLSTIDQRQIEKCDMVKDALKEHHNPKFISNKIQYAGKNTLGTYFHELLVNKCANGGDNPLNCVSTNSKKKKNSINIYLSKIVESHLYLLNSIQLLNDKGIMHLDLKENNVMHDDDNDIFILIDYGLSAQNKLLEPATYEKTATKSLGYRSFGACNAVMAHSLGEDPLVFLGRKFLNHNPLRHYYIFRNAVWLISKKYVSIGWKLRFTMVILIRYLLYPLWVTPRFTYLKMMTLGIWHGLIGRMGKL